MRAEERIFQGIVFNPGDPELKAIKLRTHNLDVEYNQTFEDETEKRARLLSQMVGQRAALSKARCISTMASIRRSAATFSAISI